MLMNFMMLILSACCAITAGTLFKNQNPTTVGAFVFCLANFIYGLVNSRR